MHRNQEFKVPQRIGVVEEEYLHVHSYGVGISVSATISKTEKGVSTKYRYRSYGSAQHQYQSSEFICSKEFTQKVFDCAKGFISGFMDHDVGNYCPQEEAELLKEVYFQFKRESRFLYSDTSAVSPDWIKNYSKKDNDCHYEIDKMRYPYAPPEAWSWFDKNVTLLIEQIKELAAGDHQAGNMKTVNSKKSFRKALKGLLERYFK